MRSYISVSVWKSRVVALAKNPSELQRLIEALKQYGVELEVSMDSSPCG